MHLFLLLSILIPSVTYWNFGLGLRSITAGCILQARMIISPEKHFILPDYAEAMAHAFLIAGFTCEPRRHYLGDPMVLDFLDISATDDFAFPLDCSASYDKGVIYLYP